MVSILPPKTNLGSQLGQAFGQGFSQSFEEKYQRGQLQDQLMQAQRILSDPNIDEQQKQMNLYQSLSGRPDIAKQIYDQYQTVKRFDDQKRDNQNLIEGIEQQRGLQPGSLSKFSGNPALAANITKPQNPPGGATFQPIPPQFVEAANKVIQNNPNASATELELELFRAGIPKGYVGGLVESRRRDIETQKEEERSKEASRTAKEKEYFKINEPKLMEIANNQRNLRLEEARYSRLENLFQDRSKFPSSLTTALFSREGQLNDIAYSQLSPEAQEAVKMIIDSTSGIKDTYGARVTNFDLQTYLKKLPSLLNTPEGKERILRDLKLINQINQLYNSGIQEIFDKSGGSDQIPYSKAERIFNQKYGDQVNQLINEFVTPSQKKFKEMPNASQYLGKKIKDEETGEVYISDGKEWKPFKG